MRSIIRLGDCIRMPNKASHAHVPMQKRRHGKIVRFFPFLLSSGWRWRLQKGYHLLRRLTFTRSLQPAHLSKTLWRCPPIDCLTVSCKRTLRTHEERRSAWRRRSCWKGTPCPSRLSPPIFSPQNSASSFSFVHRVVGKYCCRQVCNEPSLVTTYHLSHGLVRYPPIRQPASPLRTHD